MELIYENRPQRDEREGVIRSRNLFIGATLIVVGVLWLLNNFHLLDNRVFDVIFSWQMLLVVIGGYLLSLRRWLAGGLVTAVGACLVTADLLHVYMPLNRIAFPAILIAVGIAVVASRRGR